MNNPTICRVHGCGRPFKARGYCKRHYDQKRRWGYTTEGTTAQGRARDCVEYQYDIELCGLSCTALQAARRCRVSHPVAVSVLVEYHQRVGHTEGHTAHVLGIHIRTVQRYRAAARLRPIRTDIAA